MRYFLIIFSKFLCTEQVVFFLILIRLLPYFLQRVYRTVPVPVTITVGTGTYLPVPVPTYLHNRSLPIDYKGQKIKAFTLIFKCILVLLKVGTGTVPTFVLKKFAKCLNYNTSADN